MADNAKEAYFGGLPEDLFNGITTLLQGLASGGTAAAAPALSALVSLAQSEHAAAASTFQVRPIDAVFKALKLKDELDALTAAGTGVTAAALGAFKGELDNLTKFWSGK